MSASRQIKDLLYEQVARIGKAVSSPKRLELIEVLCQGEKHVEQLAADTGISLKLASAHLKELKLAHLVATRREGKHVFYRLADNQIADLWVVLRTTAEEHLLELQSAMQKMVAHPEELAAVNAEDLLLQARRGDVIVLDVRPAAEYATAHLPYARSIPVNELHQRMTELPADKPIVAYCRGPFCLMAKEAVSLLEQQGRRARRIELGVAEWRARGLPVEHPGD